MQSNRFVQAMQSFTALHQRTLEADFAYRARLHAQETQEAMHHAQASPVLGDGRLADLGDIEKAGLLDGSGIVIGSVSGRLLFYNGDGPLLSYLRTGGGKGRDQILPNCAHIRGRSLVVLDLKDGENAWASWKHRASLENERCLFLNPAGLHGLPTTNINPMSGLLKLVVTGQSIAKQVKQIALTFLPIPAKEGDDAWVRKGAIRLLATRVEYVARFDPEQCTPGGLWRFVNAGKADLEKSFALMSTCGVEAIERKALALEQTLTNAPKQFEASKADAIDALDAYEPGQVLERATSVSDFDPSILKQTPHTVFIMLPADMIDVAGSWVSLMLNVFIEEIARELGPIRTTFLLDEFPQVSAAPVILKALRVYRSKGIQLFIFAQGRFSLEGRWSRDSVKEFEDQAAVLLLKNIQEPTVIKDVELWSGNKTVLMRGVSHNGGVIETGAANLGEAKRAVLQSEDIIGLGNRRQIIRVTGMPRLIVAESVPFYDVDPWRNQIRDVRDLHAGRAP